MGFLFFWLIWMVVNALIASSKNRSTIGWVLLSIPFGLIATLVLACLPKLQEEGSVAARSVAEQTKVCPRCAETVKAAAMVCRFCNHEFDPATVPPPAQYPWEMVEDFGNGYGVFMYKHAKLVYTNRGVKWKGSTYDSPAQAIGAVDAYS
ncbi:Uncharacterised protein family UPF0547 [Burkholderia sp. GAS332]|nr:Uncharacterised protein family UPF0547 [Burkholderia sp. GAS332]